MSDFAAFLETMFGRTPSDLETFERAVTHASVGRDSYDRLEFLGDRVLGLVVASWLYERFPGEPEGLMSKRFNALVSREICAEVGRALGVPAQIRVLNGRNLALIADFVINDPFDPSNNIPYIPVDGGVRVATADVNNDQIQDIVTGKGPGSAPTIRTFQVGRVNPATNALEVSLAEIQRFDAFEGDFGFGVFVGGSL